MRRILEKDPTTDIRVSIQPHYSGESKIPDSFTIKHQIDNGPIIRTEVRNVPE